MDDKDKIDGSWRKGFCGGFEYYTPIKSFKTKHFYLGDGSEKPTIKEIVDFLNEDEKNNNGEADYNNPGYFSEYDVSEYVGDPIKLPSGFYHHQFGDGRIPSRLLPTTLRNDGYLKASNIYDDLNKDIDDFLKEESIYRDMQGPYRWSGLFFGPPGNGKTAVIRQVLKRVQKEHDAVCIFIEELPDKLFLKALKDTLADRMKIIVFEELASVLENERMERVLDFLDGEMSLDRAMIFGTTNYPERLPANISDRPGRFDKLYEVGNPDEEERRKFLKYFMGDRYTLEERKLDIYVEETKGLSVAAIREISRRCRARKIPITEAIKQMREHKQRVERSFSKSKEIGFGSKSRPRNY